MEKYIFILRKPNKKCNKKGYQVFFNMRNNALASKVSYEDIRLFLSLFVKTKLYHVINNIFKIST